METTSTLLAIILLVFGILQIILFFKLWGMTNDVNRILQILKRNGTQVEHLGPVVSQHAAPDWGIGCRVIKRDTGEQFTVFSLNADGTFGCKNENGCRKLSREDLVLFK